MQNKNKQLLDQLAVSNEKNKVDRKKFKDMDEIDDLKEKINDSTELKKALEETVFKKNLLIEELRIQNKNLKDDLNHCNQTKTLLLNEKAEFCTKNERLCKSIEEKDEEIKVNKIIYSIQFSIRMFIKFRK